METAHMPELWQMPFIEWRGPLDNNPVWVAMDLAKLAAERVIDRPPNGPRALIICGAAGAGKDHLLLQMLKARRLPLLNLDTSSESALVRFAWRHRHAKVAIVSDNAKLLTQPTMIDRLKLMVDPGHLIYETVEVLANMKRPTSAGQVIMTLAAETEIERNKIARMALRDPDIPANEFDTHFSLIWTSNINYTDSKSIPPTLRPHWAALLSRGINPRYIPDTPRDLFVYALHLVLECSMMRGLYIKLEDTNAVLRTFIEQRGYLSDVSPRFVRDLARMRAELRTVDRLQYWNQQVKSLLAPTIVNLELTKMNVPLFQIPPK
jgi:hypothetical protein